MKTMLQGPEIAASSGTARQLVVFLHGLGADGNDLIGLAPMLQLPDAHFISPHAPYSCDMAPYGHQWFSLRDRDPARIYTEVCAVTPLLNAFLDAQLARFSLSPSALALVGFSQGSMMSLHTAPRRTEVMGGVVGISGALIGPEHLPREIQSRPPVCLIHGTADDVVPFASMGMAEQTLKATGISVETHARPGLPHGIDEAGIEFTAQFLRRVLRA